MSGTRSPSADGDGPGRWRLLGPLRRLYPRTFQARLTLAFVGVVALTLGLVSIFIVNRLDDYFSQQQAAELHARAENVGKWVEGLAILEANGRPILSDGTLNQDFDGKLKLQLLGAANLIAQADVDVTISVDGGEGVGLIPLNGGRYHANLTAEPETGTREYQHFPTVYWRSTGPYPYTVAVTLSNPYTFRQTTLANVTSLLAAVGIVALGLAIIIAAGVAHRFTRPLRTLTEASRSLAEGDFTERIDPADFRAGSSELTELALQFNTMAERLEESVATIRSDRDRSRDFLADVSHELRTPIAALLTFNELLKEQAGADPAARQEFLESSRVQLERLDWLAQNLLELSKLDSGLVLLDLRPDDLRAAVESAVEQARPAARRRLIELNLSLPLAPLRVRHDPQRVGQVVTNLVGNAIKFTQPGGRVDVLVAPNRDGARIEVADTGTGIDADELPRIFERFYRGSRANEARGSGSGLGLAIVRSIVDMHHGTIAVDSRLGVGSRFTVLLPHDPRTDEAPPAPVVASADAAFAEDAARVAKAPPTVAQPPIPGAARERPT